MVEVGIVEIYLMIVKLILIGGLICGCTASATKLGYWLDRGSSTFTGIYQCVEPFRPYKNIEC